MNRRQGSRDVFEEVAEVGWTRVGRGVSIRSSATSLQLAIINCRSSGYCSNTKAKLSYMQSTYYFDLR